MVDTMTTRYLSAENEKLRADNERLRDRCEAYKGQVKAGAEEIERLRAALQEIVGHFQAGDDSADIKAYAIAIKALNGPTGSD